MRRCSRLMISTYAAHLQHLYFLKLSCSSYNTTALLATLLVTLLYNFQHFSTVPLLLYYLQHSGTNFITVVLFITLMQCFSELVYYLQLSSVACNTDLLFTTSCTACNTIVVLAKRCCYCNTIPLTLLFWLVAYSKAAVLQNYSTALSLRSVPE